MAKTEPPVPEEADATLRTEDLEQIVANFVAERAGMRPPYVRICKWLWTEKGPIVHVRLESAPDNLKKFEPRRKGERR